MNKSVKYFLAIPAALLLVAVLVGQCHAAALPEWAPVTQSCYFTTQHGAPTATCVSYREEAEDYFAKRRWSCANVIYVIWQGSTESVRCRGYDGGVIDYVSDSTGNLRFLR